MVADVALSSVGRARRFLRDGAEHWLLDDPRIASRLASLGRSGVGGFAGAGEPGLLVRREPKPTLGDLAREDRRPWREALGIVRGVARALEACERAGLFPGPLTPEQVVLDPAGAWFTAEPLVRAMVGEGDGGRPASGATKWTPPEQASGAPWDGAANRYVVGLVLYRLIAGALPFGGAGLRHAFEEQHAGAPPFEDAIAKDLRPGVQAFALRLLAPSKDERPRDAAEIARSCDALLGEVTQMEAPPQTRRRGDSNEDTKTRRRAVEEAARAVPPAPAHRRGVATSRSVSVWRQALPWLPVAVGAVLATVAFLVHARGGEPASHVLVAPATPLREASAKECAPCHAREVAEWERSVMAHAVKSPLFGALESVVEEQVGRDFDCPNGAGVLRTAGPDTCRDPSSGLVVTASGGERWCVNCHAPGDNLDHGLPEWRATGSKTARAPVRDLLSGLAMEGISCAACHETVGPVAQHAANPRGYQGNATWTSVATGQLFFSRPEDDRGRGGIANSGYLLDPSILLGAAGAPRGGSEPVVHRRAPRESAAYLRSSEFCGACHDVRLFGSDAIGARARGEHFKRLRNAYSEWRSWADDEARRGRTAPGCQGCHMSLYPGVCVSGPGVQASRTDTDPDGSRSGCPPGTHFEPKAPGQTSVALVAPSSSAPSRVASHYFTSVDIPLSDSLPDVFVDDPTLDPSGLPVGLRPRRDLLLRHTFRFAIGDARRAGDTLEVPIEIENTGAGHRVPAGFSQERETWVELTVRDGRGAVVYEVGKLDNDAADLRDKQFLRISTDPTVTDRRGRPLGLFGADVADGPDVPRWSPNPSLGGTRFRGRGLINLQNGFLRCVRCIGEIDASGACQPAAGQGATRADRFADGAYDPDTGICESNLSGGNEFFETYFPVGALDAERGLAKAPDAIIDTRSAPPGVPLSYVYALDVAGRSGPFSVEARLRFRSFPPYLVRAFASYEASRSREGLRPSGPQVALRMLRRIEVVDLAVARGRVP